MAGPLIASDIINKVPSLANLLLNYANPEETPLLDRARKGKKMTQMTHTVYVTVKVSRSSGGAYDGQEAGVNIENGEVRKEYQIRGQEFRREFGVGQQSQDIIEDSAITDQFAHLKMTYGKEIMKDVEAVLLSDNASAADEQLPGRGSRMSGLGDRLITTAATDLPIPSDVRIPSGQLWSGTVTNFAETNLQDLLKARREAAGTAADFVFLVGTDLQKQFDYFQDYDAALTINSVAHTTVSRNMQNRPSPKTLTRGLRFYKGSFGSGEVIMDDFLPNQKRGYGLNLESYTILPFGEGARFKQLEDRMGGPRGGLTMTLSAHPGDPRAHIKIVGS